MGRAEVAAQEQALRREEPLHRWRSRRTSGWLGETLTAALSLGTAVFSVLGLEDLSKRLQVGLEGVLGVLLRHDGPS